MNRIRKLLTLAQTEELTLFQLRWLRALGYAPILAGAEEADGDGDGDGDGEDEDDDELDVTGDADDDDEHADDEDKDGEGRPNLKDDEQVVSKAEFERLRRIAREAEAARKKAERDARRREEQEKREAGNWEELLRERDERLTETEAEREAARLELDATLRNQRITAAATRLGFRDPVDAQHFLSEDETQDDSSTERALKRLSREKPYLVEPRKSSAAPSNGDGPGLTMEEIKRMTPDEVNARWEEVQGAMTAQGANK